MGSLFYAPGWRERATRYSNRFFSIKIAFVVDEVRKKTDKRNYAYLVNDV